MLPFTDVKDLANKLLQEIEDSDKKIIYLKHIQRRLRVNVMSDRVLIMRKATNDKNCWGWYVTIRLDLKTAQREKVWSFKISTWTS